MKSLKAKILSLFRSKKLNVFFVFFMIALSILVLTKLSQTYQGTLVFNVKPTDVKETQVILNDSANQLIITLETHGFNWLNYAFNKPEVKVNLQNDVLQKDSTLIWTERKGFSSISKQFGKDTKVLSINPDTLVFNFDVNQVKKVPIKSNFKIAFKEGYNTLDLITVKPESINIIGPATLLQKIDYITTESKTYEEVKTNINKPIQLILDNISKEIKVSQTQVNFKLEVSKFTEGIITLPVTITNVPEHLSINYFPKQVNVKYSTTIENFNTISKTDFVVQCDYKKVKNNSFLIPELIQQPKNVKNARVEEQQIEFIITQK